MKITTDIRVRSKLSEAAMEERAGKCPGEDDYDVLLSGPTRVSMLDGRPLAIYLPGVLKTAVNEPGVYDVLHDLRKRVSRNRGMASGTQRLKSQQTRSYPVPVASAIVGAIDPVGQQRYCRLTAWTGQNLPRWELLHPLLRKVADNLREHVPERYAAQMDQVRATDPAWTVPGTPFSTVTVNNSYPTGTHTDKGDLAAGFSTIACLRRGEYGGGRLVFPQFRLAVDMKHGDLILMDAHQWHGNTAMTCMCGKRMNGFCELCGAERISVVSYYREKLTECGTPAEEHRRAEKARERSEKVGQERLQGGKNA